MSLAQSQVIYRLAEESRIRVLEQILVGKLSQSLAARLLEVSVR
jgi:hypothetical protein